MTRVYIKRADRPKEEERKDYETALFLNRLITQYHLNQGQLGKVIEYSKKYSLDNLNTERLAQTSVKNPSLNALENLAKTLMKTQDKPKDKRENSSTPRTPRHYQSPKARAHYSHHASG